MSELDTFDEIQRVLSLYKQGALAAAAALDRIGAILRASHPRSGVRPGRARMGEPRSWAQD